MALRLQSGRAPHSTGERPPPRRTVSPESYSTRDSAPGVALSSVSSANARAFCPVTKTFANGGS